MYCSSYAYWNVGRINDAYNMIINNVHLFTFLHYDKVILLCIIIGITSKNNARLVFFIKPD